MIVPCVLLVLCLARAAGHSHAHVHSHGLHSHAAPSERRGLRGHNHTDAEDFLPVATCGTEDRSDDEVRKLALPPNHREVLQKVYKTANGQHRRRRLQDFAVETIEFPMMVFHVITNENGVGSLSNQQLQQQFDRLNIAFAPFIQFTAWRREDYANDNIFNTACENFGLMRAFKLANADTTALNTYFLDCVSAGLLGYAIFPDQAPETDSIHGTVNDYRTIDDNSLCSGPCQGDTVVHEWGHAFGLFHTFQSLASNQCDCTWGDLVDDTPPENTPHYGGFTDNCAARNTCIEPDDELDPIFNYMDYSSDFCLSEFTEGQVERMFYMLAIYKPNMISMSLNSADPSACILGTFFNEDANECQACPEGTYQDEAEQTSCKACPVNSDETFISGNAQGLGTLRINVNQCFGDGGSCVDSFFADQYCDPINNNEACFYDGGDCCETCCLANPDNPDTEYICGAGNPASSDFAQCMDPTCEDSVVPEAPPAGPANQCFEFRTATPEPSGGPTSPPTAVASEQPSVAPSEASSSPPSAGLSSEPSDAPTTLLRPSQDPTIPGPPSPDPTASPTASPTPSPTASPTPSPTASPTAEEDSSDGDTLALSDTATFAVVIGAVVFASLAVGGTALFLCLRTKPRSFDNVVEATPVAVSFSEYTD